MSGTDKSVKQKQKGFAGLSSMVSNIDGAIADASKLSPSQSGGPVPPRQGQSQTQSRAQAPDQGQDAPPNYSTSKKGLIAFAVVIGIIFVAVFLIDRSNSHTNAPAATNVAAEGSTGRTVPSSDLPADLASNAPATTNVASEGSAYRTAASSDLPADLASSAGSGGDTFSMTTEDGATYWFPMRYAVEIDAAHRAATGAKQDADVAQRALDRSSRAIEAGQAEFDKMANRHERLGESLEAERIALDHSSQYAIDSFNSHVDQYNAFGERLNGMSSQLQADIDDYNRRLSGVQQKIDYANRLVSVYNGKLEQYGSRRR